MDQRIQLLLNDVAMRQAGTRVAEDGEAGPVLVVDERWVIHLVDDAASGQMQVFAHVGQIRGAGPTDAEAAEWVVRTRSVEGFTWSAACHAESGAMVLTSSLPRTSEGAAVDAWLEHFLHRARQAGGVVG